MQRFCIRWLCNLLILTVSFVAAPLAAAAENLQLVELGDRGDGGALSLAVDRDNRVYVSSISETTGAVRVSIVEGSHSITFDVDSGAGVQGSTKLITISGTVHLFYHLQSSAKLKHIEFSGSTYRTEIISNGVSAGSIGATQCGNELCISFYDSVRKNLRFAYGSFGLWRTENINGAISSSVIDSAVAASPGGAIGVAYIVSGIPILSFALRTGAGIWAVENMDTAGRNIGRALSLNSDSLGQFHLSGAEAQVPNSIFGFGAYYFQRASSGGWSMSELPVALAGMRVSPLGMISNRPAFVAQNAVKNGASLVSNLSGRELAQSGVWDQRFDLSLLASETIEELQGASDKFNGSVVASRVTVRTAGNLIRSTIRLYRSGDSDRDGVADANDPCPLTAQSSCLPPLPIPIADPRVFDPTDSDGDGLSDSEELLYGTNPYAADTDGDGFSDLQEIEENLNPLAVTAIQKNCVQVEQQSRATAFSIKVKKGQSTKIPVVFRYYSDRGKELTEDDRTFTASSTAIDITKLLGKKVSSLRMICSEHPRLSSVLEGVLQFKLATNKGSKQLSQRFRAGYKGVQSVKLPKSTSSRSAQFLLQIVNVDKKTSQLEVTFDGVNKRSKKKIQLTLKPGQTYETSFKERAATTPQLISFAKGTTNMMLMRVVQLRTKTEKGKLKVYEFQERLPSQGKKALKKL